MFFIYFSQTGVEELHRVLMVDSKNLNWFGDMETCRFDYNVYKNKNVTKEVSIKMSDKM